jgi:chromosome segregation ATPase
VPYSRGATAGNLAWFAMPHALLSESQMSCEYNLFADANAAGECTFLEKQVAELQASEAGLKKSKGELEDKLQQLEELLASTTATRDELQGGLGGNMQHQVVCLMVSMSKN